MFVSGILSAIGIPIHLLSTSIINIVVAVGLFYSIACTKAKQKYYLDVFSLFTVSLIFIWMIIYFIQFKGLKLIFANSDPAVHFRNAMNVVRTGKLPTMFFAPYVIATACEFCAPLIKEIEYVHIFSAIDMLFFIMEIQVFFLMTRTFMDSKWKKVMGLVFIPVFACGYPLDSYLYSFVYWGIAVMIIEVLIMVIHDYEKYQIKHAYYIFAVGLILNTLTMCYMLFGPPMFVIVFVYMIYKSFKSNCTTKFGLVKDILAVFAIPTVYAIYYCYFVFLRVQQMSASEIINIPGDDFRELYIDFLFLIPPVVYAVITSFKKKNISFVVLAEVLYTIVVFILFLGVWKNVVSAYYYYKFYYPLYMMSMFISFIVACEFMDIKKEIFISYISMVCFMAVLNFGGIESKIVTYNSNLHGTNHSANLFRLYNYNEYLTDESELILTEDQWNGYSYILDNFGYDEVPMVSNIENYEKCYWYEGITGNNCENYYGWDYTIEELQKKLDNKDTEYFCILKDFSFYTDYQEYFDSFTVVYQNDGMVIYSTDKRVS